MAVQKTLDEQKKKYSALQWTKTYPLRLNKTKLAEIKCSLLPEDKAINSEKRLRLYDFQATVIYFKATSLLGKEIKLEHKRVSFPRYPPQAFLEPYFFWRQGGLGPEGHREYWDFVRTSDEEIYDLVEKEGPIALCLKDVQDKITNWLDNRAGLERKTEKLRKALITYAAKKGFKENVTRRGRPENELIKRYGQAWARDIYEDIKTILQKIKKITRKIEPSRIEQLIELAHKNFFIDQISKLEEEVNSQQNELQLKRLRHLSNYTSVFYNPIFHCLKTDEKLKREFIEFRWEPNRLARQITAKLLDVTENTLDHILFPRKPK